MSTIHQPASTSRPSFGQSVANATIAVLEKVSGAMLATGQVAGHVAQHGIQSATQSAQKEVRKPVVVSNLNVNGFATPVPTRVIDDAFRKMSELTGQMKKVGLERQIEPALLPPIEEEAQIQLPLSPAPHSPSLSSPEESFSAPISLREAVSRPSPVSIPREIEASSPSAVHLRAIPPPLHRRLPNVPRLQETSSSQDMEDWGGTIKAQSEIFIEKLEKLGTLKCLFLICQIKDKKSPNQLVDNSVILPLVDAACTADGGSGKKPSLWNLFIQKTQIQWTEARWWKAKLFYCLAYSWTSLIPIATKFFAKAIIDGLQNHFSVKDQSAISKIIDNAEGFLEANNTAYADYSAEIRSDSNSTLDDFKFRAIAAHYGHNASEGNSIKRSKAFEKLCSHFGEALLQRYVSSVPFFEGLKKRPIVGKIVQAPLIRLPFQLIEWTLNKVIRFVVRKYVLPFSIQSAVTGGLDQAKPYNAYLVTQFYKFFDSIFVDLSNKIDQSQKEWEKNPNATPSRPLLGTEKLPNLVIKLKRALDLANGSEQGEDRISVRQKVKRIEERAAALERKKASGQASTDIDYLIEKGINQGISISLQAVFELLADPVQTQKMLGLSLKLANNCLTARSEGASTDLALHSANEQILRRDPVIEARKGLYQRAENFFKKAIDLVLQKELIANPEKQVLLAKAVFDAQIKEGKSLYPAIAFACERIKKKLEAPSSASNLNILPELLAVADKLDVFNRQTRFELEKPGLQGAALEGIQRTFAPLYEITTSFTKEIHSLMQFQNSYASHEKVVREMQQIEQGLNRIQAFFAKEDPSSNELTQSVQGALKEKENPSSTELTQSIQDALKEVDSLAVRCTELDQRLIPSQNEGKAEFIQALRIQIETLKSELDKIEKRRKVLNFLERLASEKISLSQQSPSGAVSIIEVRGLLWELSDLEWGIAPIPGKTSDSCIAEILQLIQMQEGLLTSQEQRKLIALCEDLIQTKNNKGIGCKAAWDQLKEGIQAIQTKYLTEQNELITRLPEKILSSFQSWTSRCVEDLRGYCTEDHSKMKETSQKAQESLKKIKEQIDHLQPEEQRQLTPSRAEFLAKGIGAVAGAFSPAFGAFIGTISHLGTHNAKSGAVQQANPVSLVKDAALASAAVHLVDAVPVVGPWAKLAIGIYAGYKGMGEAGKEAQQTTVNVLSEQVFSEVWQVFETALNLPFSDHLYHATATRIMKEVVDSTL